MKKRKKIFLLLAILSLFCCCYTFTKTYAKYFSQPKNERKFYIKRWNILINDEEIKNNQELSNKLSLNIDNLENVAENKIAPDSTGNFEINLDYTNTDLNFNYEIEIYGNEDLKDLIIYKIEINDEQQVQKETNNIINGTVNINEEPKSKKIKIYTKWNDDESASMNDEEDTEISRKYENITLDVKIKLTQAN